MCWMDAPPSQSLGTVPMVTEISVIWHTTPLLLSHKLTMVTTVLVVTLIATMTARRRKW